MPAGRPKGTTKVVKNTTMESLQKEIEEMKQQLTEKSNVQSEPKDSDRVMADDYIEVISLCPTLLTMTTEAKGRGFNYNWNGYGETLQIVYSDLQRIIKNHSSGLYTDFIREGYIYINSPAVIKKSGLQELYKKFLTKEQMDEVLTCKGENCVRLFKNTIRRHQMFVIDMLIDKMAKGETFDLNVIDQYGRIAGMDIMKYANEAASYLDMKLKN